MSKIVLLTIMKDMPISCVNCELWQGGKCDLPSKKNGIYIKKKYMLERHKKCRLREV